MLMGDRQTARQYNVSTRSVSRWRAFVGDNPDSELANSVREKKRLAEADWVKDLPEALQAAIRFLKEAAQNGNREDPAMVHSIAGAAKMLSEVEVARRVLDDRLNRKNRSPRKKH